jgi:hypothetical protein
MSRRHLAYAVLVVTSVVLSACAQPMAPRRDTVCKGGIIVSTGEKCPE